MQLLDAPLAIVDLETTGAHPSHDRVTEIAVIEVDGGEVAGEWSTLVNPGTSIPPAIQALTGITNAMVADAPSFGALAAQLHERLEGRVLVAHNARFDYGFLKQEFERAGLPYRAKTLCTVKLSRRLYPAHARHNLDSVMQRHGIECKARHRAMGDADAVLQFLRLAAAEHGEEVVAVAARQVAKQPTLPAHLERAMVDEIPDAPGVYLLYGEGAAPLYIGKSVTMRTRVLQHFGDDLHSPREMQMAREVRRIEWRRSCAASPSTAGSCAWRRTSAWSTWRSCAACSAPGARRWTRCVASPTSTGCASNRWASSPRARARAFAARSRAAPGCAPARKACRRTMRASPPRSPRCLRSPGPGAGRSAWWRKTARATRPSCT